MNWDCLIKLSAGVFTEKPDIKSSPLVEPIREHSNITLPCLCSGLPKPLVSWLTPDDVLLMNGSKIGNIRVTADGELAIRGLKRHQRGGYICTCENTAGSDSLIHMLRISCKSMSTHKTVSINNIFILTFTCTPIHLQFLTSVLRISHN